MAQEKLNLFQFASRRMAQSGTASPQMVRRQLVNSDFLGKLLHDVPNDLVLHSLSPDSSSLRKRPVLLSITHKLGFLVHDRFDFVGGDVDRDVQGALARAFRRRVSMSL